MLTFQIEGLDEAQLAISGLAAKISERDIVDEAAGLLLNRIRQRYLEEKSTSGEKWVPSLASILRAQSGRGGGTLYDTGTLFHSIQVFADTANSRLIGTDVPYAVYHQEGKGQVKREFIGASKEDRDLMFKLVLFRVQQALK